MIDKKIMMRLPLSRTFTFQIPVRPRLVVNIVIAVTIAIVIVR